MARVPQLGDVDVTAASGELVRVAATARGDIDAVVRVLAASTILDLTVEEPDLEESVLDLYARREADA